MTACTSFLAFFQEQTLAFAGKCVPVPAVGSKSTDCKRPGAFIGKPIGLPMVGTACGGQSFYAFLKGQSALTGLRQATPERVAVISGSFVPGSRAQFVLLFGGTIFWKEPSNASNNLETRRTIT